MASKPGGSDPPKDWSVVSNYLDGGAGVVTNLSNNISTFIKDEAILQLAVDAVLGKVEESYFRSLPTFGKLVAYDGFNPQTIIIEMATRAQNSNKNISDPSILEFEVDGLKFAVPKKADLAKDVQMLVTLFLVRGNNLYKILKTIGKDAKTAISAKMATYSIKSDDDQEAAARRRKEKVVLSSRDVTLSRIAASFPHITLAVSKLAEIPGKAKLTAIELQAQVLKIKGTMPVILQHGFFSALLSREEPMNQLEHRQFCYMFNLEQTITLQPPNIKKNMLNELLSNHIDNCVKFVSAAISGPMTTDNDRATLLKGLIGDDEELVIKWIRAGSEAWMKAMMSSTYSSLISQLDAEAAVAKSKSDEEVSKTS